LKVRGLFHGHDAVICGREDGVAVKGVNKVGDAVGLSAVLRFTPLRVADRLGDRG
jgi:hypothetical protein